MRLIFLLLLAPVWATAQPVAINPTTVAGYIRAHLDGRAGAETVLVSQSLGLGASAYAKRPY